MADDARLAVFGQFTPEGILTPGYGDHYLFFAGRDDVHSILHTLIPAETLGFPFNMFGFDDEVLADDIGHLLEKQTVHVQGTLDERSTLGAHEKQVLDHEKANVPGWSNSIVSGMSATRQISHTKGGVLVAQGIWFEGSTNWSASGEGTGISLVPGTKNAAGFKAQNNTLLLSTNPVGLARFQAQLDAEHLIALQQQSRAA